MLWGDAWLDFKDVRARGDRTVRWLAKNTRNKSLLCRIALSAKEGERMTRKQFEAWRCCLKLGYLKVDRSSGPAGTDQTGHVLVSGAEQ